MRTIGIVNQKGGAGKTTLAINLALAAIEDRVRTLIVDTDPQASATFWAEKRSDLARLRLEVVSVPASRVETAIASAAKAGAGLVIIDTAPQAEQSAFGIAKAVDGLLVPCQPAVLDVEALRTTANLIRLAGKPAIAIANAVRPNAVRSFEDLKEALESQGLEVAPVWLSQRQVHRNAMAMRQGVIEFEPVGAASREVEALWRFVRGWIGFGGRQLNAA